jgi:hypothetical protein
MKIAIKNKKKGGIRFYFNNDKRGFRCGTNQFYFSMSWYRPFTLNWLGFDKLINDIQLQFNIGFMQIGLWKQYCDGTRS